MIRVGYRYKETSFDGGQSTLTVWDVPTRADADVVALRNGWTPPRWWQWWRWWDEPRTIEPLPDKAFQPTREGG
jgi:hypothetical protein